MYLKKTTKKIWCAENSKFSSRNKKAALELSMNTIVVIVIGVTLLILGLAFVRNMFTKVGGLAEGAFEQAEGKVGDFSQITKPLTISPERISLGKGESKEVVVIMANLKEKPTTASITVSSKSPNTDITCTFQDTIAAASDTYTIPSGEFRTVKVLVESIKDTGTLGNKVCKFVAKGIGEGIQETLAVKVQQAA